MTPEERESEISRCCSLMISNYESGYLDSSRTWARNMAHLISERSDEVVQIMENNLGLSDGQNKNRKA